MDRFCLKQFAGHAPAGGQVGAGAIPLDPSEFVRRAELEIDSLLAQGKEPLKDGYAPYCKVPFRFVVCVACASRTATDEGGSFRSICSFATLSAILCAPGSFRSPTRTAA